MISYILLSQLQHLLHYYQGCFACLSRSLKTISIHDQRLNLNNYLLVKIHEPEIQIVLSWEEPLFSVALPRVMYSSLFRWQLGYAGRSSGVHAHDWCLHKSLHVTSVAACSRGLSCLLNFHASGLLCRQNLKKSVEKIFI